MSASPSRMWKQPWETAIPWLLVTFLVLFPKGGVKLGPLPFTWGYLFLGLSFVGLGVLRVVARPARMKVRTLIAFASALPFQVLFIYSFLRNGIESASYAFGTFVSFFVLPVAFLLVYPSFLQEVDGDALARHLRFCIFAAAVYGIFLFFLHPVTGQFIEIPFLTVNADDYGLLEKTKHIDRGLFQKLISTYNNGNLYGVSTLILLPLYEELEPRRGRRLLLKVALILTLSRSVWFGLVVDQLLALLRLGFGTVRTFPRVRMGATLRRGLVIGGTGGLVLLGLAFTRQDLTYLFDSDLGGRVSALSSLSTPTWLPTVPVGGLTEITYASALDKFGRFGCMAIVLFFTFPIALYLSDRGASRSRLRMAALKGMMIYMIVSCLDGAISLIPVMAFYWFVYMIFLEGWPPKRLVPRALPVPPYPPEGEWSQTAMGDLLMRNDI